MGKASVRKTVTQAAGRRSIFGGAMVKMKEQMKNTTESQNPSAPIHPLMHIPVPWVFVLTYLMGLGLQFLVPLPIQKASSLLASHIAGWVLLICGLSVAGWSLGIFRSMRTTTVPFRRSAKLVTWGPYRFSRNPMYVSLTLMYLGEAGILAQIWPVLLLPFTEAYLQWIVIPYEETQLRGAFGDAYKHYCASVPRWIKGSFQTR